MGYVCSRRQQPSDQHHMGTAVRPAKTSPASWNAFPDVDAFVDAVLAELAAMAADGTRRQRVARRRKRPRSPRSPLLIMRRGRSSGVQGRAFG